MIDEITGLNESHFGRPGKVYNFKIYDVIIGLLVSITGSYFLLVIYPNIWSLFFILLGVWYLLRCYSYRKSQFRIYQHGLIFTDNKSKKTMIYWKDIDDIIQKITKNYRLIIPRTSYEYTLIMTDGLSLRIPNYVKDVGELCNSIKDNTFEYISSRFRKKYNEGNKTQFGELIIDKVGITYYKNNNCISWNDIKKVQIKDGEILIFKGDLIPWKSIPISSLSNYKILISFLKEKLETKFCIISEKELIFYQSPQISNPFKVLQIVEKIKKI